MYKCSVIRIADGAVVIQYNSFHGMLNAPTDIEDVKNGALDDAISDGVIRAEDRANYSVSVERE